MSILVDSASVDDVVHAAKLGFVTGVTTNPSLMRRETDDPLRHAGLLLAAVDFREFYYQPTGAYGSLHGEAERAWALDRDRVIVKVPATPDGVTLAQRMVRQGARVSLTAAQTPVAMIVAESIGCESVIPYLNRALCDVRVGGCPVRAAVRVRRGRTRIVAASVKNPGQVLYAFDNGADAVTASCAVLDELLSHPAAAEAERDFLGEYAGGRGVV